MARANYYPMTTAEVARRLGVPYGTLYEVIRRRLIPQPANRPVWRSLKAYAWEPEDVERARVALSSRRSYRRRKVVCGCMAGLEQEETAGVQRP